MKIQILGTGCPKCKKLAANAEKAVHQTGVDAQVEKVTDVSQIAEFGVMFTPAIAIDGEIKSAGKVVAPAKIAEWLK